MSMHNSNIVKCTCLLLSLISATVLPLRADDSDYSRNIKPLLKARCFACHGALKQEAGLRLDTGELIRKGSENGSVVDVENPKASELLIRISADDDSIRMPPIGHPLTSEEQQLFASKRITGRRSERTLGVHQAHSSRRPCNEQSRVGLQFDRCFCALSRRARRPQHVPECVTCTPTS